jgi:hypothetical protein
MYRGAISDVGGTIARVTGVDNTANPSLDIKETRTGVTVLAEGLATSR